MNDRIKTGTEHGVEWKVDESKFNPVIISVKKPDDGRGGNESL